MIDRIPGRWLTAGAWILPLVVAAVFFAPPGPSFVSFYAFKWYAVPFVLVAVAGRKYKWAARVATGLGIVTGAYFVARYGIWPWVAADTVYWPFFVGGLVVGALGLIQIKGGIGILRALDPVVLAASQISVGLVATWTYYAISRVGLDPTGYDRDTWRTPFTHELPILALAFAAVGLGVSRRWAPSLDRLGITWPLWWQPCLALLVAGAFVLSVAPVNDLTYLLMPNTYSAIAAIETKTSAEAGLWVALVSAVMAGLAEETLFRGALQPRAGIVITALLFAMIHIQYGVSPILAMVFVHGLGYGLLRRYINTTTAIMAHAGYDIVGSLGLQTEIVAVVVLIMALTVMWAAMQRFPAYVVALGFAALLWLVGVAMHWYGANLAAFVCLGVGGCLLMSLAVGFEANRRGSVVLGWFGIIAWLVAAAAYASDPFLRPRPVAVAVVGTAAASVGIFIWYALLATQARQTFRP
jgi:membrane protease YdiL (CAAX protease family)